MGDPERPNKVRKVVQNHQVNITQINTKNMDHFCNVVIAPDFMNPNGLTKRGIRINANEFSKGARVLGERCSYRLLTPLSTFAYASYLNRATEEFLKNGTGDGPARPVLQVYNQSPFRFHAQSYVAVSTAAGQRVFQLFASEGVNPGFASEIKADKLPFIVNWCGPHVQNMEIDDKKCQATLIKIIEALEQLQPNIEGLGVCLLAEFGRFILYNCLVDGQDTNMQDEGNEDDDAADEEEFVGYKQMMLVLQSGEVETGKSFLSDVLLRIFYGVKHVKHSTLSFDSAKSLLGKGEPVIIDDYNNDDIGCVLLSRSSKAIWGKAQITLRNQSVTPAANLLICTNEDIPDLKVEGKNKEEVYMKMSVISLGEEPMKSKTENKGEKFKEIIELAKVLRSVFPIFMGLMLQTNSVYITSEEFKQYEDITKHERLANLLHNVKNLCDKLTKFCEVEQIDLPKSLEGELDFSCMTDKSELVHRYKSPDQIINILISHNVKTAPTMHEEKKGVVFDYSQLTKFPWFYKSFRIKKDGQAVYCKMRTRQLTMDRVNKMGYFISFDFLREASIEKISEYVKNEEVLEEDEPGKSLENAFKKECYEHLRLKKERALLDEGSLMDLVSVKNLETVYKCESCGFVAKNKGGLTRHVKSKH